jgi:aldose sugar dehydrogenase
MAFLPDHSLLVTERKGSVRLIHSDGFLKQEPIAVIANVKQVGEGGLLGIAVHPHFEKNHFIYLYYTYANGSSLNTFNRVSRFVYEDNTIDQEVILIDQIPGSSNHNGGRMKFGKDGLLYIGTGDAEKPSVSQDIKSLAGKILRTTDTGQVPESNPFSNLVYAYGFRNVQGIAWDDRGQLWATDHGSSFHDEINRVEAGKNYGWPIISGKETKKDMETPSQESESTTWAPGGLVFHSGSLYMTSLKGQSLYSTQKKENGLDSMNVYLTEKYGRIRDIVVDDDGLFYISTSNTDGRGTPVSDDDKIIRINPSKL